MKKRNKKYRPKRILSDPISYVMSGMKSFTSLKDVAVSIMLKQRMALEALRTGHATHEDIGKLMGIVNLSQAFAELGKGEEFLPDIRNAEQQLVQLAERGAQRGLRFTMTAEQWAAMKDLLAIHEAQLEICTVFDIERAFDLVEKRFKHGQINVVPLHLPKEPPCENP